MQEEFLTQEKPKPLKKNQVKFKWTEETELFVIRQYAEFIPPLDICVNLAQEFPAYCEKDIETHGENAFYAYVIRRVYDLNPKRKRCPKKYLDSFEEWRQEYVEDLDNSYLFHRRNRIRELDTLYAVISAKLKQENDLAAFRQGTQVALSIIKEARAETEKLPVTVVATIEESSARATADKQLEDMSDEELNRIIKNHESGNPAALPIPKSAPKFGNDLSNGIGKTGETEE